MQLHQPQSVAPGASHVATAFATTGGGAMSSQHPSAAVPVPPPDTAHLALPFFGDEHRALVAGLLFNVANLCLCKAGHPRG